MTAVYIEPQHAEATSPVLAEADRDDLTYLSRASKSEATWKAYRTDNRHFAGWCDRHDYEPLPTSSEAVCLYLRDLAAEGFRPSTMQRRLTSISQAHKAAGYESPTAAQQVRQVMQGIRRSLTAEVRRVEPVTIERLRTMVATCDESPAGIRDRAALLLAFASAVRRSELVGLDVGDVTFTEDGLRVRLRRSKTDQEGEGRTIGVPFSSDLRTCPVRTLRAWLDLSGHEVGPLFLPVTRHGRIGAHRLSGSAFAGIVKRRAGRAGFDPAEFSGHSTRAGFCTSAAAAGAPDRSIMRQTGHRSHRMLSVYIREGSLFRGNAAGFVL